MSNKLMLISNKLHSFRNFTQQIYNIIQNSTKYTPIVFPNTQRRSE